MYLMKILMEETDEEHDITLAGIIEKLKSYDETAERNEEKKIKHFRIDKMLNVSANKYIAITSV